MTSYNGSSFNSLDWDKILILDVSHCENKPLIILMVEFRITLSAIYQHSVHCFGICLMNIQLLYNFLNGISVLLPITE